MQIEKKKRERERETNIRTLLMLVEVHRRNTTVKLKVSGSPVNSKQKLTSFPPPPQSHGLTLPLFDACYAG